MSMPSQTTVLIFDEWCGFCVRGIHFLSKKDKSVRIRFLASQSEEAQHLLNKHGLVFNDLNSLVYVQSDRYYLKSTAVLHLLKDLGGYWSWVFVIMILVPRYVRDCVYDYIARHRYCIMKPNHT